MTQVFGLNLSSVFVFSDLGRHWDAERFDTTLEDVHRIRTAFDADKGDVLRFEWYEKVDSV
jgi:hypothetical protein